MKQNNVILLIGVILVAMGNYAGLFFVGVGVATEFNSAVDHTLKQIN